MEKVSQSADYFAVPGQQNYVVVVDANPTPLQLSAASQRDHVLAYYWRLPCRLVEALQREGVAGASAADRDTEAEDNGRVRCVVSHRTGHLH